MTADTSNDAISPLEKKIIRQVEFYFGDYNLHRDKFMKEHIAAGNGWFSMDVMMKFQRLSSLCSEPGTILAALKKSPNKLLELDIENQQIRRKESRPVPENNEKYRQDLKMRTVYVKGFPQTETIENITDFFEDYGCVEGVFLRKFKNPHTGAMFKGSLFVTFGKAEEASSFVNAPMVYYKDQLLEKKSKDDFWKEKDEEFQDKRKTKLDKIKQAPAKNSGETLVDEYSYIYVSNLTDQTISHIDMKEFLRDLGANECKFFSRYEKNGPTGYLLFPDKESADQLITLLKDISEDSTGLIKSTRVKFEMPTEEQEKEALQCYYDFRGFNKEGKRRGGRTDRKRKQFQLEGGMKKKKCEQLRYSHAM